MQQQAPRFDFIDSVRGLAVIFAMLSHSFLQFTADFGAWVPLTRTATPAFIILFGIMLEIAYLQKLRAGRDRFLIEERLISRMLTCYLFFAAITVAAFATGKLGKLASLKALLFIDDGFLGVILKIYSVLFLLVILLLPLLKRFGVNLMIIAAIVGWCLKYLLDAAWQEPPHMATFIFGNGDGFAPSILPSMTFLAFGMAFGEFLSKKRGPATFFVLLLLAVIVTGFGFWSAGSLAGVRDEWLASRWINHPLYYSVGICTTTIFLGLFWLSWREDTSQLVSRFTATMGQQSLFIYGAGNVALALLPAYSGGKAPIAAACVVSFMVMLLLVAWVRAKRNSWLDKVLFGIPTWYSRTYDSFIRWSSHLVLRILRVAPRPAT